MERPQRIQLKRKKGWRLPAETVCVTRPGKWGNPFRVGGWFKIDSNQPAPLNHFAVGWQRRDSFNPAFTQIEDHAMAVKWFSKCVSHNPKHFRDLRGKNLACWCPPDGPCHANVLLEIANSV